MLVAYVTTAARRDVTGPHPVGVLFRVSIHNGQYQSASCLRLGGANTRRDAIFSGNAEARRVLSRSRVLRETLRLYKTLCSSATECGSESSNVGWSLLPARSRTRSVYNSEAASAQVCAAGAGAESRPRAPMRRCTGAQVHRYGPEGPESSRKQDQPGQARKQQSRTLGQVLELVDLEFRGFAFESPDVLHFGLFGGSGTRTRTVVPCLSSLHSVQSESGPTARIAGTSLSP